MGADAVPRREVVTGEPVAPRGGRPRPHPGPAVGSDAGAPDDVPPVRALVRRQARLALGAVVLLVALLGPLPLILRRMPSLDAQGHVPLVVWLALGVVPYPVLLCIGRWYVRRAERHENEYVASARSREP
ncbi:hypothetical protein AB0E88_31560 [Streptomyces sp. NPDC028635]|uniref:hypothetical protein n=1 Tax=Streptomyces sp. NPDC028635 TaxID=3154800 RepID=UPI00340F110B